MKRRAVHRNLWALTVLSLLRERSMHPYEMQRLIRERHKDDLLDLRPGSLYHAVERLEKARLIEAVETTREGKRPERTTYRITEAGTDELLDWLRDWLARPGSDPNQYVAAVSHLPHLPADEVAGLLANRAMMLEAEIAAMTSMMNRVSSALPRLVMLEAELSLARLRADLAWTAGVIEDLRSGALRWDIEKLRANPIVPGDVRFQEENA